jgi:hypothetical protein
MTTPAIKGSCLCGAVSYEIHPPYTAFRYCHCQRCRKASGSAHAANLVVPQSQFTWLTGDAGLRRFDLPGAKRFAVWFCPQCGTRTPHKMRDRDDYLVPAGTLDADPGAKPAVSIFWASRPAWYVEPSTHERCDEYS